MIILLLMVLATQPAIGSVSTVGPVELRAVPMVTEGTLFSGDRVSVGREGYAKVALDCGARFQLGAGTSVTIRSDTDEVSVRMESGNVAFSVENDEPVRVHIHTGSYEMIAEPRSGGSVAFSGSESFGVRVIRGSVRVRNPKTQESFVVMQGTQRLISMALPAFPSPASPTAGRRSTRALTAAGILGGTAAAIAILISKNDDRPGDAEGRFVKAAEEAATTIRAVDLLGLIASQSARDTAAVSAVASTAAAADAAISASTISAAQKAALRSSANVIIAQANALIPQRAAVDTQALALKTTIQNQRSGLTNAQLSTLNALLAQSIVLESQVIAVYQNLLSLLEQAQKAGVPNLPPPPVVDLPPPPEIALPQPVPLPGPVPASASAPL